MAVGDIVGTLTAVGGAVTSFVLINNPGGFFSISGSNLIQAIPTPDGIYPITIKATGPGYQATTSFSLDFTGSQPIPPPVQEFFFGLNLSGAENEFPVFATFAQFKYWTDRGVENFRIPFAWSKFNSINNSTVGIQHASFGDLDTTSLGFPLQGINHVYQSDAPNLTPNPWHTFIGAGSMLITANVGTDPNGFPYHLITATRPDSTTYGVLVSTVSVSQPGTYTGSFLYKASGPSDVGRSFDAKLNATGGSPVYGVIPLVLGSGWQQAVFTVTIPIAGNLEFDIEPFIGSSLAGAVNINFSEFQVNAGPTALPYSPTVAGYVQAMDDVLAAAATAGAKLLLDCHMFGAGPDGDLGAGTPPSALADMFDKVAQRWGANPVVWGMEFMNEPVNGFDPSIVIDYSQLCVTAVRVRGFTGKCCVDGVNFTGVWNWVSGQGQPFNNSGLYVITDPLNNLLSIGHGYFDSDSSGFSNGPFSWQIQSVTPGLAPPGISTSHDIGTIRLNREWLPWLAQHGVNGCYNEFGISVDQVATGGTNDWADWIVTGRNAIDRCKSLNIPCFLWGGGIGFPSSYGFNFEPYSAVTGAKVFDGTGVDSVLLAGVINHYVNNTHPPATAYLLVPPQTITPSTATANSSGTTTVTLSNVIGSFQIFDQRSIFIGGTYQFELLSQVSGTPNGNGVYLTDVPTTLTNAAITSLQDPTVVTNVYGTVGTPTNPLTIIYGGIVPSGAVITPHAKFSDGSDAGGTFNPPSVSLTPGENALATTVYTPANVGTIFLSTTNNQGWTDPPAVVCSTQDDQWKATGLTPSPLFDMYRSYTPSIGPVFQLQHPVTGALLDWSFTNGNNLDRVAIQAWAGRQDIIPVTVRHDLSPYGHDMVFSGTLPTLLLQDTDGYPSIVSTAAHANFSIPLSGKNNFTALSLFSQGGSPGQGLFRQDLFTGPVIWGTASVQISNTGFVGNSNYKNVAQTVGTVSLGITSGYHQYVLTYAAGVTNGLKTYKDGSFNAQAALSATITASFTGNQTGTTLTVTNQIGPILIGDSVNVPGIGNETIISGASGVYQTSVSGTAVNASSTCTSPTYTINASGGDPTTHYGYFQFGGGNWSGSERKLAAVPTAAMSAGQVTTFYGYDNTHYTTPLPDTLPPIFVGVTNANVVSGSPATPFGGITLQDAAGTSISILFTLTGHAATLSGTGLTGSGPYTLTADTVANINTNLHALQFNTTGTAGQITNIAMVATSSTALTCSASPSATIITAVAPVISSMVAPNVYKDQGAPALWQVSVTDSNPSPTVSASITVTGSGGTLSHLGPYTPSGTGPYTFPLMTPTELTRALRNLLWLPSVTTVGTTTTFALTVTNNLGLSASASNTMTNIVVPAMPSAITPIATPGTLPRSYKGINFSGGEFSPPIYPTGSGNYSWAAGEGLDTIRLSFLMAYLVTSSSGTFTTPGKLYQNFDSNAISSLKACVENARQFDQYIIFDDHSFGGILNPFPSGTSDEVNGSFLDWTKDIRVPLTGMVDAWSRLFSLFQNYPNIILGLINELNNTNAVNRQMLSAVSTAVGAIGTFGATVPIYSCSVSNVAFWDTSVGSVWNGYTDPRGPSAPFFFDVHQYFDGHGGTVNTCTVETAAGYFDTFTNWCRANSFKAVSTEFAYGTDTSCSSVNPGVPNYFTANNDVYIGWNWFSSAAIGTSYVYYLGVGGANLQLPSLTSNLGNTF